MKIFKKTVAVLLSAMLIAALFTGVFPVRGLTVFYTPAETYLNSKYYAALTAVNLTGDQRTDIVNIALSQEGYKESDTFNDLSGAVQGEGDYTEYGRWYSPQHPNYAWCAIFINWCARQAGISTSVITTSALAAEGNLVKSYTAYTPNAPIKPGDILHFKNSYGNHVGLVYAVDKENLYTIEGNCSDSVKKCYYKRATGDASYGHSQYISHYASPDYKTISVTGASTLKLTDPVAPKGNYASMKFFGLSGIFTSNYPILAVRATVTDKNGILYQLYEKPWSETTYNIAKDGVDANVIFGDLPTDNAYRYTVEANDLSGKTVRHSTEFSIGDPTQGPKESTLTLTGATYPQGVYSTMKFFGLAGTFSSNYPITFVESYILDENDTILQSFQISWSKATFDVEKNGVDNSMIFGDLKANAQYTYRVKATDASGKVAQLESHFAIGTVKHTVTYNANGGTNAPAAQTKKYGTTLKLSAAVPLRDRFIFLGWSADQNATLPQYSAGGAYDEEKNITLYAVWEKTVVPGDFGDDGILGADDIVFLQRTILGDLKTDQNTDLNGDGVLDVRDLVHLKRMFLSIGGVL